MTLWLLNHIPSWILAVSMIVGLPLASVVGCSAIRTRWPSLADGDNNEFAGVVLSVLGGIYGIVLAFVIVVLWEQFQDAQNIVSQETTALSQIVRDSRAFPDDARRPLVIAVRSYSHSVVDDEWPRMAQGDESAQASLALTDMYRVLHEYQPSSESAKTFYA